VFSNKRGWAFVLVFFIWGTTWLFTNPLSAAPEEPEHYIRALASGSGQWLGVPNPQAHMSAQNDGQRRFFKVYNRTFEIPAKLSIPPSWFCLVQDHSTSAKCLSINSDYKHLTFDTSYEGGYQPYMYILPGIVMLQASNPEMALYLGRVVNFLFSFFFLAISVFLLLHKGSFLSLTGLLLAASPMVVFVGTVLSPSAPEIYAAIGFWSALVYWFRTKDVSFSVWSFMLFSLFVLIISRALGLLWLGLAFGIIFLFLKNEALDVMRERGRKFWTFSLVVSVGMVLSIFWQLLILPAQSNVPSVALVVTSLKNMVEALGETVGVFGWVDTVMPKWAYAVWTLLFMGFVILTLLKGKIAQVRKLEGMLFIGGFLTFVLAFYIDESTGFLLQGRQVLPMLIAIPLFAAEILNQNRDKISKSLIRKFGYFIIIGVPFIQLVGWFTNAHRAAVGTGGELLFWLHPDWSPVFSWEAWGVTFVLGCILFVLVAKRELQNN
jgi:hypothetical protein